MSALSAVSSFVYNIAPLAFVRTRLARFGAFIRWLGTRLTAKDPHVELSQKKEENFLTFKNLVGRYQGNAADIEDMSLERVHLFRYLLEEEFAEGEPAEGIAEFIKTLSRQIAWRDFEGARASLSRVYGRPVNKSDEALDGILDAQSQINMKPEQLINDLMQPAANGQVKGHESFVKDAHRTGHGRDSITVEGMKFQVDAKFEQAYRRYLSATQCQDSNDEKARVYAHHLTDQLKQIVGIEPKWIHLIQCVIHQDYRKLVHKEFKITPDITGETTFIFGQNESFPKNYTLEFDRNSEGEILALNVTFRSGYRAQDTAFDGENIGYVDMTSKVKMDFREDQTVRVVSDHLDMKFFQGPKRAFDQINSTKAYYRSHSCSLADGVAKWSLWGANTLSFGYLEEQAVSSHLSQVEEYIRHSGHQSLSEIRERLAHLCRLYQETGRGHYDKAALAMVRALFEQEIIRLNARDVEENLSRSISEQFTQRTEDGDLQMFVRDNGMRPIMKTDVIFRERNTRYNSESKYYSGDKIGQERRYFEKLRQELHRCSAPTRDMVEALMTQSFTLDLTADLFEKTAWDGYSVPGDIPGAASSSIVVRSDERITYTLKTRYKLVGRGGQSAGEIEVDAAVDLRYEDETWIPRLLKRDIKVIHDM